MMFSNKLSKFGKGKNLSAFMEDKHHLIVYYFEKGISKKEIIIEEENISMNKKDEPLGYHEVIPVTNNILITRIDKSIGLVSNE